MLTKSSIERLADVDEYEVVREVQVRHNNPQPDLFSHIPPGIFRGLHPNPSIPLFPWTCAHDRPALVWLLGDHLGLKSSGTSCAGYHRGAIKLKEKTRDPV